MDISSTRLAGPPPDAGAPLTVGLFCPGWPPERLANGIVSYTGAVAEGMVRLGHRPCILAGRVEGTAAGDGPAAAIDLKSLGAPGRAGLVAERMALRLGLRGYRAPEVRVVRALRRALRGAGGCPPLDLLEMEESFGWARQMAGRVPLVVRLHGPWFINGPNAGSPPDHPDSIRRVRLEGEAIRSASGVTSPSQHVLDRAREHYGLALERAEVIPNPVRRVAPEDRWRPESCEAERLLFVGRFDRIKGGDVVIEAFARVLRDRPGARLTFVGPDGGVEEDGRRRSLAEYVERRLPGALADGRVEWLGRRAPHEIAPLRRRAAVTILASRNENFPMSLIEAMAVGCPLVATRAGGAAEAFDHGVHGLYVEPEDAGALASAVASMLADPVLAAAMGRAAAEHCERHYSPDRVASRTIAFYDRVMAGSGSPRGARP